MAETNPGYSAAIRELEDILESIEGEDIDLDQLAGKVQRAADLIRLCRDRIKATELKVVKVVKDLEVEEASGERDAIPF